MKLNDIKSTKPKKVKEAINPALSFERKEPPKKKPRSKLDPVTESVMENWKEFKQNEPALPPLKENLRNWFKEKWVRFGPDGKIRGECGGRDDSEGKPKCLPASKAHSLGKKGRASAAARKRREDPNPERSGAAINVATRKKTNEERCPHCGGEMVAETELHEKKDACYYKVKSRYKVWPSAYASGALVKCRKKGAKNWGSKSESIEEQQLDEKCWDTHRQVGMKKKGGRMVPNCVPKEGIEEGKMHISPSGVQTNMDPADDDYEINYGKNGGVAKFRRDNNLDVKTGKKLKESRMKDLAMDLRELSDGEFFEKYGKSKGQMQSSLQPEFVEKDPASYNDDDFYAFDPETKLIKSVWSHKSVGRRHHEYEAQRQGWQVVSGMRAKHMGLKVRRRMQGMLEAEVTKTPSGTYSVAKAKTWNPDPETGTLSGRKRNIPGALVSLAKQAMGFDQKYNTADIEADPRLKRHVNRYNDDDWIIIDPASNAFVSAAPRGTSHHREFTLATSKAKPDWNKIPGIPLPSTVSAAFGGQPYVAVPGSIANYRRIAEDQPVNEDQGDPFVVYVSGKPIGKFDTPEEAKHAALELHSRMPRAYIDIRKTECTDVVLQQIAENENLYL